MTEPAAGIGSSAGPAAPGSSAGAGIGGRGRGRRGVWRLAALGLLGAIIVLELAAGPALRPLSRPQKATVLAIPGATAMIGNAHADPAELTQVAANPPRTVPSAFVAQAVLDGVLLITLAASFLARARFSFLGGHLALLLAGVVVTVAAVSRLRYLVALYLSPPVGTISYLLQNGSFRRQQALLVVSLLVALKAAAGAALWLSRPSARAWQSIEGLALSSLGAAAAAGACMAFAPVTLAGMADAMAGATVALVAVVWAAVLVSRSMRRLS